MNSWNRLFIENINYPEININNYFDYIYYINLDRRIDRYNSITHQLKLHNINGHKVTGIEPEYNSHKINNGQLGCLLTHLYILQDAFDKKYKTILILEDDTIFKDNFRFLFNRFIYFLPIDWEMIYLSGNHYGGTKPINEFVSKSYGTLSTNAYGLTYKAIKVALDSLMNQKPYTQPIDSIYCSMHYKMNTYSSTTNLCYQMAGFSDIENKFTDYHILK